MTIQQGLKGYKTMAVEGQAQAANPHTLIAMLMGGALEKMALGKRFMEEGNVAEKGLHISWAIRIIDGLEVSLDKEKGGEIAERLGDLYQYMKKQLLEANRSNKPELIDEVIGLMTTVKDGWDDMPRPMPGESGQDDEFPQDSAA